MLVCISKREKQENRFQEVLRNKHTFQTANLMVENHNQNHKFQADKISVQSEEYMICTDGYILNLKELLNQYVQKDLQHLLVTLYNKYNAQMFNVLKGRYAIFFYDMKNNTFLFGNDHLSTKPVYYFDNEMYCVLSTSFSEIVNVLKELLIKINLNETAVLYMLSLGQLFGDVTYVREIKHLDLRCCISYLNGKIELVRYDKNDCSPLEMSEDKLINELHSVFERAVKLQYQKNVENGYSHLSSLSAGMDSRSCILYANRLGYKDIDCFTYAQSGSVDQKVSTEIANDLGLSHLFYSMTNGHFLKQREAMIRANEGLICYSGTTGLFDFMSKMNVEKYGIVHTGLLGGEVMGDFLQSKRYTKTSDEVLNKLVSGFGTEHPEVINELKTLSQKYENYDDFRLENEIRSCVNFMNTINSFLEACSPFLYYDFYSLAKRIDPKFRYNRSIYRKWMNKYIPNSYITTNFKTSPNASSLSIFTARARVKLLRKIRQQDIFDMNPLSMWISQNKELEKVQIGWFEKENEYILKAFPVFSPMVKKAFCAGGAPRQRALTLLWSVNRYFGDSCH